MSQRLRTSLAWLFIGVAVLMATFIGLKKEVPESAQTPSMPEEVIPPYTPEIAAMLEKSRGFEVLISYTDRGFEPTEATLERGQSARFTNNSSHELWVAAEGTGENPVHPGMSECGGSALDTCRVLKPNDFWEFTFVRSGTWMFRNNLSKEKMGSVYVEVM